MVIEGDRKGYRRGARVRAGLRIPASRRVIARLADRSTAWERVRYHVAEAGVYTGSQLPAQLRRTGRLQTEDNEEEHIYALFKTRFSEAFAGQHWDGAVLVRALEQFESDLRHRPVGKLGRRSPFPRILPINALLKVRA